MKKNRDVKFIIYQSLYIFVICVVALKGANIDLTEVIEKDTSVTAINKDMLKNMIDTSKKDLVILTREEFDKLEPIDPNNPPVAITSTFTPVISSTFTTNNPLQITEKPKEIEEKTIQTKTVGEIIFGSLLLYKYHTNSVNNQGDAPITVKGITIPPHSTAPVTLQGEDAVTFTSGSVSRSVGVKDNLKPDVRLQQLVSTSGDEISVSKLQQTVGYRVTILDDFTDQLDIKITGPVSWKVKSQSQGEIVIDVTLNAFPSASAFNSFKSNNPDLNVFTSSFTVAVKDKIAPHNISRLGQFKYTDW